MLRYFIPFFFIASTGLAQQDPGSTIYMADAGQEDKLQAVSIRTDQDIFSFDNQDRNYTMGLFINLNGGKNLERPWMPGYQLKKYTIDKLFDRFVSNRVESEEKWNYTLQSTTYNFQIFGLAFTPEQLSDTTQEFYQKLSEGYRLEDDRPFSFLLGIANERTRDYYEEAQETRFFPKSLSITTGGAVGLYSTGIGQWFQTVSHKNHWFNSTRPIPVLWESDASKPHPTGQIKKKFMPAFLVYYQIEKPILFARTNNGLRFISSVNHDLNVGFLTNASVGVSFALGHNDHHFTRGAATANTGITQFDQSDDKFWKIVGGVNMRGVLHNGHLSNLFDFVGNPTANTIPFDKIKRIIWEYYLGVQVKFLEGLTITYSPLIKRTAEFTTPQSRSHTWGAISITLDI